MLNATLCLHDYTKLPSFHVHDKFFCYALKLSTQLQHTLISVHLTAYAMLPLNIYFMHSMNCHKMCLFNILNISCICANMLQNHKSMMDYNFICCCVSVFCPDVVAFNLASSEQQKL